MATAAQIIANRSNAEKSTGPKTLEGKQRSAQNARRLGLFVSDTTLAREEAEELARLLAHYTAQYCPDWEAEHQLVRQLALATLRQHRYAQAEADLLTSDSGHSTAEQIEANERTFASLLRAQAQADRLWHRAYTALEKLAAKRLYTPRQAPKQLVLLQPEPEPNEANSPLNQTNPTRSSLLSPRSLLLNQTNPIHLLPTRSSVLNPRSSPLHKTNPTHYPLLPTRYSKEMTVPISDLRYPVGQFHFTPPENPAQRQQWIEEIAALPIRLREAVAGLSGAQLDTPYRPDGWTVRQVVHHVADSHLNSYVRFRLALTEENPTVKPYDEARWAELPDGRAAPVEVSLTLLTALHERWVQLLRSLTPEDLARTFHHPALGPMTIEKNIALYAWHGRHHLAHITSLREREDW